MNDSQVQLSKHENNKKKNSKRICNNFIIISSNKKNIVYNNKKLHTTNSYIKKWNNVLIEHGKQQKMWNRKII